MIGATMHHTPGNFTNVIIDRIRAGWNFNAPVPHPAGSMFEVTACRFGQEHLELEAGSMTTLNACKRMEQQLREVDGAD